MKNHISSTILIPNGTSPKNLGDQAMLVSLLGSMQKTSVKQKTILHSFDPDLHNHPKLARISHTLYSWAVFDAKNIFLRVWRVLFLFANIISPNLGKNNQIINDYNKAHIVLFAPGGYLRSRKGFTQSLNLVMQLVPFWIAFRKNKKTLGAPMSIGPFAYQWQEWIVAKTLGHVNKLFVREVISYKLLEKYEIKAELNTDMALYKELKLLKRNKTNKIGLIVREWGYSVRHQNHLEKVIVQSLQKIANKKISIQPFVQVDAPEYGDYDKQSLERVIVSLKDKGCTVAPTIRLTTPKEAEQAYKQVDMLITMRLHAALLALRSSVLSIIISDEHKSEGIMTSLGLHSSTLHPSLLTEPKLSKAITETLKNNANKIATVKKNLTKLVSYKTQFISELKNKLGGEIPQVTVALSAYNEEENITRFLQSVLKQKEDGFVIKEIVVVSDGSTDKTVERAKSLKNQKITIIDSQRRIGKSQRLNQIYKNLKTKYLIQSDADVIFSTPFVIREMVAAFEKNSEIGMCGGNPQPLPAETYIEQAVNSTVYPYIFLRHLVRNGNNPFSADGRLLAFRQEAISSVRIPNNMIANDRYTYYKMKMLGWKYKFVPQALVQFRSPQTVADHIRQNVRFVAAPQRLRRHFPEELIHREESISLFHRVLVGIYSMIRFPLHLPTIIVINRYCEYKASIKESKMNALWDMALTTKGL